MNFLVSSGKKFHIDFSTNACQLRLVSLNQQFLTERQVQYWSGPILCKYINFKMAANTSATSVPTSIKPNPSKKEKETLLAVLQFLKKNKLPVSYRIVMRVTLRFFERKSLNASCCVCFFRKLRRYLDKKSMAWKI